MPYYPILVNLEREKVIVVGGGIVAQRKIDTLLQYGAVIQIISQTLNPALNRYVEEGTIQFLGREFKEDVLDGAFMVIAATDDPDLNRQVSDHAKEKGLLINAVDQPSDCNFIVPSILRRGDLIIAVSTSGNSPALAKKVREKLEEHFGGEYALLLQLMGWLRKEILSKGFSQSENRRIFHELVDSPILEAIGREGWDEVATIINKILRTDLSPKDLIDHMGVQ